MDCPVCTHPEREEIENMLMNTSATIEDVADKYAIDEEHLKRHFMLHNSLEQPQESIARNIKKREADLLAETAEGYMNTFVTISEKVNRIVEMEDSAATSRLLTNQVVNLYLGLGKEIRETVKAITELDTLLNGPKDENVTGLMALANAIRGSV